MVELDFECDQCGHSWKQELPELIEESLTTKEIKELIEILEDWVK